MAAMVETFANAGKSKYTQGAHIFFLKPIRNLCTSGCKKVSGL